MGSMNLPLEIAYLASSVLFILGLKALVRRPRRGGACSSPRSAW